MEGKGSKYIEEEQRPEGVSGLEVGSGGRK